MDGRLSWSTGSSPSRYSHQYWAPVVANHFPPTSPFTQGQNLGYTLLPQGVQFSPPPRAPFFSHQPLTRQRSGGASGDYTLLPQTPKLERKRSKKGTREVSPRFLRANGAEARGRGSDIELACSPPPRAPRPNDFILERAQREGKRRERGDPAVVHLRSEAAKEERRDSWGDECRKTSFLPFYEIWRHVGTLPPPPD